MSPVLFTDLDGTLLGSDNRLSPVNRKALDTLGQQGVKRVVVTGRSLFSSRRVVDRSFPIDILVTSSGAGIFGFPALDLLLEQALGPPEVTQAVLVLKALQLDFMVHDPVPDNHRFQWYRCNAKNPDFDHRLTLYEGHHQPIEQPLNFSGTSAQLVAISTADDNGRAYEYLKKELPNLSIIRTTSPLDHQSTWYEIFPKGISKSGAATWVCRRFNLDKANTLAIGNDYNDLDLLRWSTQSRVVDNAPSELTQEFATVSSHDDNGFAQAVNEWLGSF